MNRSPSERDRESLLVIFLFDGRVAAVRPRSVARLHDAVKGAAVNIKLNDGERREARVETPLGHHTRPVPVES